MTATERTLQKTMPLQEELEKVRQLKQSGKRDQALEALLPLLDTYPDKSGPHLLAGELYEQLADTELARKHFRLVLEINPKTFSAMMGLGRLARSEGREEEALPWFERVLQFEPEHVYALRNQALSLISLQRYDDAEKAIHYGLERHPDDIVLWERQVDLMLERKEFSQVESLLNKLQQTHADHAPFWMRQFRTFKAQKKHHPLLQATESAFRQLPGNPLIAAERIQALQQFGQYDEALACTTITEERSLSTPHYLSVWGNLQLDLGRLEHLRELLAHVLPSNAEKTLAINKLMLLAKLEKLGGNFRAAAEHLQQILDINPSHRQALELLTTCDIFTFELGNAQQRMQDSAAPCWDQRNLLNEAKLFPEVIEHLKQTIKASPSRQALVAAASAAVAETPQCILGTRFWLQHLANLPGCFLRNHSMATTIPKRLFQYWHESIPGDIQASMATWRQSGTFQEYRLFNKDAALQRIHAYNRMIDAPLFEQMDPSVQAGLLRLLLLYEEGGVWANADCLLRHTIPEALLAGNDVILLLADSGHISTQWMAAAPGQPILKAALDEAIEAVLAQPDKPHHQTSGSTALSMACARTWGEKLAQQQTVSGVSLLKLHEMRPYVSFSVPHDYHRYASVPAQLRTRIFRQGARRFIHGRVTHQTE